jgi:ribosome maturation factor RimP
MPVNNKCTVTFKGGADVYEGTMVNISANGFAFQTRETEFADCKGENIIVKVPDFPVEQGRVLEGTIIRSTDNDGSHIVGCRMPEDRSEIGNYVSRNYSE